MMAKKKPKLAMEDYLDFIDNRTLDLNATQLRQSTLVDMVSTMDLMDLRRSTLLHGGVSGGAGFTLEEVINDLKDLDWNECHVTSLLTQSGGVVSAASAVSSGGTAAVKRKKAKGLKRKPIEVGADQSVNSTGTTVAAGSTTESLRSVDCNSVAAVSCPASPPIVSLASRHQRHRLLDEPCKV
ncbi:hypothetical protein DH2020_000180 [Rehmannia glutinosa]|uniref:Uncharacterized protein n=1 Tax=Rehmannia glutinosa TaxID=99300 RepID=A0ABR0XW05_REHGL